MSGIFKAYDIRGVYPAEINAEIAEKIGRAYVEFTGAKKVVVGRDMRPHSADLFEGLAKGLTIQGADVIDLGLSSTPQSYFANGTLKADGSIMITASHNPGEWNGFKLCLADAVSDRLEDLALGHRLATANNVSELGMLLDYLVFLVKSELFVIVCGTAATVEVGLFLHLKTCAAQNVGNVGRDSRR